MNFLDAFFCEVSCHYRIARVRQDAVTCARCSVLRFFQILRFSFRARKVNVATRVRDSAQDVLVFDPSGKASNLGHRVVYFRFIKVAVGVRLALQHANGKRHSRAKGADREVCCVVVRCLVRDQLAFFYLGKRRRSEGRVHARLGSGQDVSFVKGLQARRVRFVARVVDRRVGVVTVFRFRDSG